MSNTIKKISAISLSVTTAVWLSGAAMILPVASAATVAELQVQIASLLAQIQALQALLVQAQPAASYTFTKDLTLGSKGDDVKALQQFLNAKGYAVAASGAGSAGSETTTFGSLTKAALAKYQAAVGISPAAGYFGPKTRAYVASLAVAPTPPGAQVTPTAPSTGLAVSLASDNPVAGSMISGASRIEVLKVALTAGTAGAVTVNTLKFTKTGAVSDAGISNAYLVEGGKVIAQYSSISGGVITFSSLNLSINAGQTRYFTLGIDPSSGLTAGNTLAFSLKAVADVTALDTSSVAITPSGVFPLNSNTFTLTSVSNPSIASLAVASSSVGTTVYAGTQNALVSQWTLTVANSSVKLSTIKFSVVGSANKNDIQNVKLKVNGTQVGSTLTSVSSDGSAYFDLSASPAVLVTGTSNLQVYADVTGSPSFNFDFGILNSYDVLAIDSTYNSGVTVTVSGGATGSTSGHQITINQGAITVTAASDTPTGNVAKGASGVTLAKFSIYAAGEAVKVKYLDFKLVFTGTTGTIGNIVRNISLIDNAGNQVGSTISTPATTATYTCTGYGATPNYSATLGTTWNDCVGYSSSPINYIIPANTTRVLSLKADIQTTAAFTTIAGQLSGNSSNLQGMTSSQSASSGSASGAALTLALTPLSVVQNTAFGTSTYAVGSSNAKIGSYILNASAAEGVNVSNLTLVMGTSSVELQNVKVKVDNVQFGNTQSTLSGSDTLNFSGSFNVPAGGSKTVEVYGDILSSAGVGTKVTLTRLNSCVGTGAATYTSVSCSPTAVNGQNMTVASGPTYSVTLSSASAPTKQVVMGSTNNSLASFRFADTANVEATKITKLIVSASSTDSTLASAPSFENVKLYNGTTLVGGPVSASSSGSGLWAFVFNFSTPPVVPQNGALELETKGDVATYISGGSQSNKNYIFKIAATSTDITSIGQSSNSSATPSASAVPAGYTLTVLRTKLTLTGAVIGSTSGRTRTAVDDIANLTFSADSANAATVNSVTLKFQGMAVSTTGGATFTVDLIDPSTGTAWSSVLQGTCLPASNSCSVRFNFTTIPTISAGSSKQVKVRVDSSGFYNASTVSDSVTVLVNTDAAYGSATGTGLNWGDGTTSGFLYLESTVAPITITTLSYE